MEKVYSIGVDVSKKTLDVCLMGQNLKVLEIFKIKNNLSLVKKLKEKLKKYKLNSSSPVIMESTADYHILWALLLKESNYKIKVINPLSSFKYSAQASIRNCKTDKKDAIKLAEIGIRNPELPLFETTTDMIKLRKKLQLLKKLLTRIQALKSSLKSFQETLKSINLELDKSYFLLLETIKNEKKVVKILENEIKKEAKNLKWFEQISAIKWISELAAWAILSYISDKNFKNKHSLTAFAWLDINVKQSWTSIKNKWKISKKGNNMFRAILTRSVWWLIMHNPVFKELDQYYKNKGKHYFERLVILARKLLHIIYWMLKNNSHFDLAKIFIPKAF